MSGNRYFMNAWTLLTALCFASVGCHSLKRGKTIAASQAVPTVPPSSEVLEVGEVVFVRGTAEPPFVLIKVRLGVTLPDTGHLEAVSPSGAVARLEGTTQRRGAYRVANIVSGRPRLQDRVRLRYPRGDETQVSAEDEGAMADIPPLPSTAGRMPRAEGGTSGEPDLPRRETLLPSDPAPERPAMPPVGNPLTTADVEPRAPERRPSVLELPSMEAVPDEGEAFVQPVPES